MKKYYNILHIPTGLWVYKYHPTCHIVELTKTPRKVLYGKTNFNPFEFNHTTTVAYIVVYDDFGMVIDTTAFDHYEVEHGFCSKVEFEFIDAV